MDYRLISVVALVFWGAWGYLSKLATRNSSDTSIALWATLASLAPIVAFAFATAGRGTGLKPSWLIIGAGLAAGIATVAFYAALSRGPTSVVVPLTGMYIIIPALLGMVLLHEPLTVYRVLGLACAGLAVFFLSR
ncbi:DMT family transporter [candidate division WOR-3 bacterium]|nr:DMT family transporter [candidate division WOR-3 bacterium]